MIYRLTYPQATTKLYTAANYIILFLLKGLHHG